MSKSKHALKPADRQNLLYLVENLRCSAGHLCRFTLSRFLVEGFKLDTGTMWSSCGETVRHSCGLQSHSTQHSTICWNHPRSNFFCLKKDPFEGWPLQKLIVQQTRTVIAASVVLGVVAMIPEFTQPWSF